MPRLNIEMSQSQIDSVKALTKITESRDMKDVINVALAVLEWAVDETLQGNEVAAVDSRANNYRVLIIPQLRNVKKKASSKEAPRPHFSDVRPRKTSQEPHPQESLEAGVGRG